MGADFSDRLNGQIAAHAEADLASIADLRGMSLGERAKLIELACRAAAVVLRDREATGLPPVRRVPWPQSTWDFLSRHATRVRDQSTR